MARTISAWISIETRLKKRPGSAECGAGAFFAFAQYIFT